MRLDGLDPTLKPCPPRALCGAKKKEDKKESCCGKKKVARYWQRKVAPWRTVKRTSEEMKLTPRNKFTPLQEFQNIPEANRYFSGILVRRKCGV